MRLIALALILMSCTNSKKEVFSFDKENAAHRKFMDSLLSRPDPKFNSLIMLIHEVGDKRRTHDSLMLELVKSAYK